MECERYRVEFLGQPANSISSAAFVVAAVGILTARRHNKEIPVPYAVLVGAVGVGSFIQHGPHPDWQAYAHDLPLAGVLVFVAVDALSDLRGRELSPAWWLVSTAGMIPVVACGPAASTAVQAVLAVAAIGLNLVRAARRPALRRTIVTALAIAVAGSAIGKLLDGSALCRPDSLPQGHAIWHILAATALWRLAPAIGARQSSAQRHPGTAPFKQEQRRIV